MVRIKYQCVNLRLLIFVSLIWCVAGVPMPSDSNESYRPIVLVAGFGGSQAFSQMTVSNEDAKQEWLTGKNLLFSEGFTDRFRLMFDKTSRSSYSEFGTYFFPGITKTWHSEFLGNLFNVKQYEYFSVLVEELLTLKYYRRGLNIAGVPYDWRKIPSENRDFIPNLKKTVESLYSANANTRVIIVCHSMGGLFTVNALNKLPLEWKQKYLHKVVLVGSPLGGSVKALIGIISGSSFGLPLLVDRLKYRRLLTTFTASYLLLPKEEIFGDRVLMHYNNDMGEKQSISAKNISILFDLTEGPYDKARYEVAVRDADVLKEPEGVDIACLYGVGVETAEQLNFNELPVPNEDAYRQESEKVFNEAPEVMTSLQGDGTVNLLSLRVCQKWKRAKTVELEDAGHVEILHDPRFINNIMMMAHQSK